MFEEIVKRGTLMTVITLIICTLGIVASSRIPVQMIPDLEVRVISIRTTWPGATPQDIEKEILIEQEQHLRTLPNLARLKATANKGSAEIELEFPFGTDLTETMIKVNNALSRVPSYPESANEPRIYASSFSGNSFMFFSVHPIPGNPRQLDIDVQRDFIEDHVTPLMTRVPGVSEIAIMGGAERQLQIQVDPVRLAQRQLTLSDVRNAVRGRNRDISGGDIDDGKRQYLLRTIGRFHSIEELNQLILERRGDAVIRLQDVATVTLSRFEKQFNARYNGHDNMFLLVRRETGSNVIDIKNAMMALLPSLNEDILNPAGMRMLHVADDVHYVQESIENVWQNLILGSLLAIGVMYLFLRSAKATAVGVMGIPVCIIVAFLGLLLTGRTINVISLAGVAFAIGMTLDNSIVVLESIELEKRRGATRWQAAVLGVKKVWPAVFASTLTTVLVFLPVAFVKEEAGQLYSDVAIAISSAILASMLIAITVLPTAAARLHLDDDNAGKPKKRSSRIQQLGLRIQQKILNGVHWLVATRRRQLSCIGLTTAISASIIIVLTPPAEYLPEGEEPKAFATLIPPPGYNLATMDKMTREIEEYFLQFVDADPEDFHSGKSPVPALKYINMRVQTRWMRIISETKDPADIDHLLDIFTAKFQEYPGMRAFAARGSIITSNDGGTRSINLDISGPDLPAIYEVAESAYRRALEVFENPRIQTQPSLALSQPMVEIHPDWQRAAELGLSAGELGFIVASLTDGSYVDEFFLSDDKIDIYLYSKGAKQHTLDTLGQLPIYTPSGTVLPLGALSDIRETVDTDIVRRVNGKRTVTLNIIPPRSVPLETGVEIVQRDIANYLQEQGEVPIGINLAISGAADQLDATKAALTSNYLIALLIIYLLLVAIFNHWGYPLLIMTSIPLGIAGGIVGLWLLNAVGGLLPWVGLRALVQPFDMISMLGFLILMGTVVNNPILIVHRAVSNFKLESMKPIEAVNEAVDARLRPIAMSTITTLFGLAPLVLIPGAGTELYRGVGAIVMFGIIGAALVTLTMLPALTAMLLQFMEQRDREKRQAITSN